MRRLAFIAALWALLVASASAQMLQGIVNAKTGAAPPLTITSCANAAVSSTSACTGTYTGTAPASATGAWNSPCSGSSTITSFSASAGAVSFTASTPAAGCVGTLTITTNIPTSATSPAVTITGPGTIALISLTSSNDGTSAALVGTYTSSAPSGLASLSYGGTNCPAAPSVSGFSASGGNINATISPPASTGFIGCTLTATGTGANTGTNTSPGAVVNPSGWTLVAHATAVAGSSSGATTPALRTTGANVLVGSLSWYAGGNAETWTDSLSNSWTEAVTNGTTGQVVCGIQNNFTAANVGTSHTFTAGGAGSFSAPQVEAWFNATTSSADQTAVGTSATASVQLGSLTPSVSGTLVVLGVSLASQAVSGIDSGFTISDSLPAVGSQQVGMAMAWLIQGAAAALTPTATLTGTSSINQICGEAFRP